MTGAPSLPDVVKVGACDWTVTLEPDAKLYGKTKHKQTAIVLCPQSPPSLRDSLLHEVLHALAWTAGADKILDLTKDDEERLVRLLTPHLLALIRDNDALIRFLTTP